MSAEQNKDLVRRFLEEVWGRGDTSHLQQFITDDVKDHQMAPGQPCGIEGQRWGVEHYHRGLSNVRLSLLDLVAEGDRVYDRWHLTAVHTGDFFGMAATGRQIDITGQDETRIANGKIAEVWHIEDILGMMRQMGYAPPPPQQSGMGGQASASRTGGSGTGNLRTVPPEEQKQRMRRAFEEMVGRGNLDAADEYIAPDFAGHYSSFPDVYSRGGFKQFLSSYISGFSNRSVDVADVIIDGDHAACRTTLYGTNTGILMGMPPTGKQVHVTALNIFRMAGQYSVEQWANNEDIALMQQLGVVPQMAGEPAPC